jgi:hypothetical protein
MSIRYGTCNFQVFITVVVVVVIIINHHRRHHHCHRHTTVIIIIIIIIIIIVRTYPSPVFAVKFASASSACLIEVRQT